MLQQQFASLDLEPEGGSRWLMPTLLTLVAASGAILFLVTGMMTIAALFLAGGVVMLAAAFAINRRSARPAAVATLVIPDYSLVSGALDLVPDPVALSRSDGRLVTINQAFSSRFGAIDRIDGLSNDPLHVERLAKLLKAAWRDGRAPAETLAFGSGGGGGGVGAETGAAATSTSAS